MEKRTFIIVLFAVVSIIVLTGAFWAMNRASGPMDDQAAGVTGSPSQQNQISAGTASDGAVVEEIRAVDVDAVIREIESSSLEDEAAFNEEFSDETTSIQEGQVIIEQLGQSYDETSY